MADKEKTTAAAKVVPATPLEDAGTPVNAAAFAKRKLDVLNSKTGRKYELAARRVAANLAKAQKGGAK